MQKITIDSFKDHRYVSQLRRSPGGRYLAYVITTVQMEENRYMSHIHVRDLVEGRDIQLTNGKTGECSYQFLDEETILFMAEREEGEQDAFAPVTRFYRIDLRGGEAVLDLELPLAVSNLVLLDKDRFLLLANYVPGLDGYAELEGEDKTKRKSELEEERDYEVLTEIPFWNDGGDFSRGQRNRLYSYIRGEKQATALTGPHTSVYGLELSEDKRKAVFVSSTYTDKMPLNSRLMSLDCETMQVSDISPYGEAYTYEGAAFLDGGIAFYTTNRARYGLNQDVDIHFLDLETNEACSLVDESFDKSLWNSVGSDARQGSGYQMKSDGKHLYFLTTEGISSHLNRIDRLGAMERLTKEDGSVECFDIRDGDVYLSAFRSELLPAIHHLEASGAEALVCDFNPALGEFDLAKHEAFSYEYEGDVLEAFALLPPDYDETKSYPSVLTIHGGPKTVYGTIFFHEMQFLASRGYIVYYTNPRGSDGQGRDWADIRGRYGEVEYEQLMALCDTMLARYPAMDPERMGVTGGSYGGFMTNWIVGHTDRFKAAVTQRSISNMISMFGISDIGYYFIADQAAATPWTDADELWRQSPLKYADRVKTPTLVLHSDQDYRCPLAEGIQFYTALKYHGVESRMVIFKGESHGLSRGGKPKHRIRRLRELSDWFDRYLAE